jgi:protease II
VDNVVLDSHIPDVRYPSVVWAADNQSFYYSLNAITQDSGRQTCGKVYLHRIGHDRDVMTFDWRTLPELAQKACENVNLYTTPDSEYLIVNVSKSISGYGGYLFAAKKTRLTTAHSSGTKLLIPIKMFLPLFIPGSGFIWRAITPPQATIFHVSIWPLLPPPKNP